MAEPDSLRIHGDPDRDELARAGIAPDALLDFSVNVSPLGPHPAVVRAASSARLDRYPDTTGRLARESLADALGTSPDRLVLGNGAADLLWGIARSFVRSGPGLVVGPTFSEFPAALRAARAESVEVRMLEDERFAVDLGRVAEALRRHAPPVVYLCHPNNPTGRAAGTARIGELAEAHPTTTFVLDEAFLSLSERHAEAAIPLPPNTLRVRSLTKDHALPGLRVAYALGAPALVRKLESERPPWTTSAPAQAAIVEAMRHPEHVVRARETLLAARRSLVARLEELGLDVVPSETIFVLVRTGDADALRARLLERHGILVRSATSFGLPEHLRLCARPTGDVDRLVAALTEERAR